MSRLPHSNSADSARRVCAHALVTLLLCITPVSALCADSTTELSGEFETYISEDISQQTHETIHVLHDRKTGRRHRVRVLEGTQLPKWRKAVRMRGHANADGSLRVEQVIMDETQEAPGGGEDPSPPPSGGSGAPLYAPAEPPHRIALIVVGFSDKPADFTLAQARQVAFGPGPSAIGLFPEATFGRISFDPDPGRDGTTDAYGPFTIASASTTCTPSTWGAQTDVAAQQAGINLSQYEHVVYFIPSTTSCGWSGYAAVGCTVGCRAWVRSSTPSILAHELGHNLYLGHARVDANNDFTSESEYGDWSSFMGNGNPLRLPNAPHAYQLQNFAGFSNAVIDTVTGGTFTLQPLMMDPVTATMPQIVRIRQGTTQFYYYLSVRQAAGTDSTLGATYLKGISIHRKEWTGYKPTDYITTLGAGGVFNDPVLGVKVTQLESGPGNSWMRVKVELSSSTCTPQDPILTLSPPSDPAFEGQDAEYLITLQNKDSGTCAPTRFALSSHLSSAPGTDLLAVPATLTLAPGQSAQSRVILAQPKSIGSIVLNVQATDDDSAEPYHAATENETALSPTRTSSLVLTAEPIPGTTKTHLSWTPATGTGLRYHIYRDGLKIGETTSLQFDDPGND